MKKRFTDCCKKAFILVLATFSMVLAHADNPPLMGWSSWNTYGFQINDSVIKSQADAMVELGFYAKGYNHINIDDGFFGGRDSEGNLLIHPTRFPDGLRPLVDYIHSKGLKAGIYSDAGGNTCASFWGGDSIGVGVGLYGHDEQDMNLYFNELNFDFIKVDYCGADGDNNSDGLDLDVETRYKEIAAAIAATGRTDVSWNICRWAFPGTWACDIADSWRTTEDIYLGWESVKSIIGQSLYLSAYTSYGHYNDMDMLEVGRGLTTEEDKTHFGMWCIMSSPLLIGCDLNDIKGDALELMQNEELIALNQNDLGLQAYVVAVDNGCYVLVKDIETLYGNKRAVAFYNPTNSKVTASVAFSQLDLAGDVAVRDLFEKQDVGTMNGTMTVDVPAHGTRIYSLNAEERLERTIYEAETAWLTNYQEIKNNETEGTAIYSTDAACSGGVKVGWLGNNAANDLQWRNVYSMEGGEYTMRLSFITGEDRTAKISVNDGEPVSVVLNSGGWSTVGTKDITIHLQKGNNVVRLYNENAYMPDIDCMRLINPNAPVVVEDYPIIFDKNQSYTRTDRSLNGVALNGSKDGDQSLSIPTPRKVYSLIDSPAFTARAGETVTPSFQYSGTWMNGFVYIDCGQDGAFEAALGENAAIPEGSDIMAFSYAETVLNSGNGYNSNGERVSNANVLNPPSFVIPADLKNGFYRMRYKVDWASADPAGRPEDGNGILKNGGAICDVRLNVHGDYCTVNATAENGSVTTENGDALNAYEHRFGTSLAVRVTPEEGYVCDGIEIKHGHNLDGEEFIHGVQQYSSSTVPGYLVTDNAYTIPAEYFDGDVDITVLFVKASADGSETDYALSFNANASLSNRTHRMTGIDYETSDGKSGEFIMPDMTTVYGDMTSFELLATPGIDVNVSVSAESEELHYYMYIDFNNDGKFIAAINDDGTPTMSSELVSYTYYNGKNSRGEVADAVAAGYDLPEFTISQALPTGVYRVRIKADNNDISSEGSNEITSNGGSVVDFLLNVCNEKHSLKLFTTNGNIYGTNKAALPMTVAPFTELNVVGVPVASGYMLSDIKVRHGHNFDGPQYIHGNRQWSEYVPDSHVFVMPADSVNGDVEITMNFVDDGSAEYKLVFSDEFNAESGTQPTADKWMRCQRYGATWNRWLSDSEEVIYLEDGDLVARAIPNPDTASDNVPMITGGIKSYGLFGFTYGYVECRILTNPWTGNFPAFWMMPEDQSAGWPDCGEIDIFESIDGQNRTWHTIHSNWTYDLGYTGNPQSSFNVATDLSCYQTYALEWNENTLVWFVNGKEVGRYAKSTVQNTLNQGQWPFDKHFHLILNQSVGNGSWAANADVSHVYETRFDWVRVYQKEGMLNTSGTVGINAVELSDDVDVTVVEGGVAVSVVRPLRVNVYDVAGRVLFSERVEGTVMVPLSAGIYIVNNKKVAVK